jgi:multidrug efflux pump subunit AcrB
VQAQAVFSGKKEFDRMVQWFAADHPLPGGRMPRSLRKISNRPSSQLGLAMLVPIALVFMIMVGHPPQRGPAADLDVSIPFAATGAIAGLLVTDTRWVCGPWWAC